MVIMELLRQASSTQVLYPAAAVVVVLVCAALVFIFGFHSAEQPQFDKLPLVLDDKKSANKKRKTKDKKSSPNRTAKEDGKTKSEPKKSASKEKKEEKPKEVKKPVEPKVVKKTEPVEGKKNKKIKNVEVEKPADFDDAGWQEVPKKSDKKKAKPSEEKPAKESPSKKSKRKVKEAEPESNSGEEKIRIVNVEGPEIDEEAARELQRQVEQFQRAFKEAELRELSGLSRKVEKEEVVAPTVDDEVVEVKDLRSNKKKENKEKQKKKTNEGPKVEETGDSPQGDENQNVPVFDELGDAWTDAKAPKKGKKKARKDQ